MTPLHGKVRGRSEDYSITGEMVHYPKLSQNAVVWNERGDKRETTLPMLTSSRKTRALWECNFTFFFQ